MVIEANGERDSYRLERFVEAQRPSFAQARSELLAGQKQSHWMWFVFPQLKGLGSSAMAQRFGISGVDEATAYLMHPLLGDRLRDCTALVNAVERRSVGEIFGYPDDLKFHSSITLFAWAARGSSLPHPADQVFAGALSKYFGGKPDQATVDRLQRPGGVQL